MLDEKGFDLWADGYDQSVSISEEDGSYPFAGYKDVLGHIYTKIRQRKNAKILDIGFGTAVLSKKLYDDGYEIYGIDFSSKMIEIAKQKMPKAHLISWDMTQGFPHEIEKEKFDVIVTTYAIHHVVDSEKSMFLKTWKRHLKKDGVIYIGDVAFETEADRKKCREQYLHIWDDEEEYMVEEMIKKDLPDIQYTKITFCSGVFQWDQMWKCPKCGRKFKNKNQDHYCGEAPKTIEEYIERQPEYAKEYLQQINETVQSAIPNALQKISWSMPTYWKKHNLIQFAAFKKHIGFYPGSEAVVVFANRLQEYKTSKGAIQLPYDQPLPLTLLFDIAKWCEKEYGQS